MKKLLWSACIVFCAVLLNGCALPERSSVSSGPSTPAGQPASVPGQESGSSENLGPSITTDLPDQQKIVEQDLEATVPSASFVSDRIYEYGRKMDRWKELDNQSVITKLSDKEAREMVSCFAQLQDVLNGYSELRTKLLQVQGGDSSDKISTDEFFQLQKNDIAFVEGVCGRLLAESENKDVAWAPPAEGADLTQFETMIDKYAGNREYQQVIQVWSKIPGAQADQAHLRTKLLYAQALMYLHQEEKAAEIYQKVVDQMADSTEQATDIVSLRKVLADLYTASGNYPSAATQYQKISADYEKIGQVEEWAKLQLAILARFKDGGSPELTDFAALLKDYLGYLPERDGYKMLTRADKFQTDYPYSPVSTNVEFIKDSVRTAADRWFNGVMAEVDKVGQEKDINKALRMLENIPLDMISPEKQLVVKAKIEELQTAEAVANEAGKMAKIQDLQNQWNNGMLLANGGRYEEALVVFNTLLNTEYADKARAKIDELSLEAAKADRKKAADYFIRFTRTTDLESKKKLLVESRKLLKNILVKYPNVEIAAKVQSNIARVEQEMNAIDPNLVYSADQGIAPASQDNGLDRSVTAPEQTENLRGTIRNQTPPVIETGIQPPAN